MRKNNLKRIDTPFGRAYALEKENEVVFLPSVTSILSLKESNYLKDLEANIGKEELQKISNRAALRGTAMHKFVENYFICIKNKGDNETCLLYTQRKSTDSLLEEMERERVNVGRSLFYNLYHSGVFDKVKKILFTEKFLYSEEFLFAGTTDFGFSDIENKIVIADFKSASSPREYEIISKYKCQLAAYSIAFEELYKKPVDRGEVWISYPDGVQIETVEKEEMLLKKKEFLDLTTLYHSLWNIEPFEEFYYNQKL